MGTLIPSNLLKTEVTAKGAEPGAQGITRKGKEDMGQNQMFTAQIIRCRYGIPREAC